MNITDYANCIERGMTNKEIAKARGYTDAEMRKVLERLGVIKKRRGRSNNDYREWTDNELEKLKDLSAAAVTDKEIGKRLNRSVGSVKTKRKLEGIKKGKKARLEQIHVAYKDNKVLGIGSIKELSKVTEHTYGTLVFRSLPSGRRQAAGGGLKVYRIEELKEIARKMIDEGKTEKEVKEKLIIDIESLSELEG